MSLRLTKAQRAALRGKYDGCCAYCGCELGERWHADHFEPVLRGYAPASEANPRGILHVGRDVIDNFMPSCAPCNLDKTCFSLDQWRAKLAGSAQSLARYSSTYRHAKRFGLIQETGALIVFHFERVAAHTTGEKPNADQA